MPTKKRVSQRARLMPNPWPPDNIVRLIEIAVSTAGLAPSVYKLIGFWIDDRKARKIKVRVGDTEIELQGGVANWKNIERACITLRKLRGQNSDEGIDVLVPAKIDRSLSIEQARAANEER